MEFLREFPRELTDIELDEVSGGAASAASTTGGNVAFALSSAGPAQVTVTGIAATASFGPFAVAFAF
jgi:hypothetical protein